MGAFDAIGGALQNNSRKFDMASERTIEEVFGILKTNTAVNAVGAPEFKKGIFGKNIQFPKISRVTPKVTVKGKTVLIQRIQDSSSSGFSVGGVGIPSKDMRGGNAAKTIDAGTEYFVSVCDVVEDVLKDK